MKKKNYALLSAFLFLYFFAQAMSISLLALWLKRTLGLTGTQTGVVFSANFIFAMASQPIYGFLSDKVGFKKSILWVIAGMVTLSGVFFAFVYGPLLKTNLLLGAALGGVYLGVTFIAGSYALESYVDRVGRKDGFEYSRARLWGSLGFAFAAFFSGRLYNIDPLINFSLASLAGLLLLPILAVSIFRYIAANFEARLASTLYLVGVSFGHSLGLAVLSPIVGRSYDLIGFPHTYLLIALGAALFWTASLFTLSPTPDGAASKADPALKTALPNADLAKVD